MTGSTVTTTASTAAAGTGVSTGVRQQVVDKAQMWADLWSSHQHAEQARFATTRRAELFLRVGNLPLIQVLDALSVTEAQWQDRVRELRRSEARSRVQLRRPPRP